MKCKTTSHVRSRCIALANSVCGIPPVARSPGDISARAVCGAPVTLAHDAPTDDGIMLVEIELGYEWDPETRVKARKHVVVHCEPTDTLSDLKQKAIDLFGDGIHSHWFNGTMSQRRLFDVRGCTLPEEVTLGALALEPGEYIRIVGPEVDCREPGEPLATSVARLFKTRAVATGWKGRVAKATLFNTFIDRTIQELTMPDAAFNAIKRLLEGQRGRLSNFEAVRMILDASHDYLSFIQASELIQVFSRRDAADGDPSFQWGSFGDWMHSLALEGGACEFQRKRVNTKPCCDAIGTQAYPQTYYGLDWEQTYTYLEARAHIAKVLIGTMGRPRGLLSTPTCPWSNMPVGYTRGAANAEALAIIADLDRRAQLRSAGMRGWSRLITLAPLIGRWALFLKPWYLEVSLKPEIGSVWLACRDRYTGMNAASTTEAQLECADAAAERAVRQRVA